MRFGTSSSPLVSLTECDLERLGPPLWVMRDADGALHLDGCLEASDPFNGPLEQVELSVLEVYAARGRCPCGDFPPDPVLSSAFEVLDAHAWVVGLLEDLSSSVPLSPASALASLRRLEGVSLELERLWGSSPVLVDLLDAVTSDVAAEAGRLRELLAADEVRAGVLATAFLVEGAHPVSDGWLRSDVEDAFPGVGPAFSAEVRAARAAVFNAWVEEAARGGDAPAAALQALFRTVSLRSLEQLPDVPVEELPPGLSLLPALRSCWRSRLTAEVASMVGAWEGAAATRRAAGPGEDLVVLFDPALARSDVFSPLVSSVYAAARLGAPPSSSSSPLVLRLPRVVFDALRAPGEAVPRAALFVSQALPGDTSAVFETALSLWAESEPSSPESFAVVLAAARALCASPLPS